MLTFDPSLDYKHFDFLIPATYYKRLTETTWDAGHAIFHCWFQDTTRLTILSGANLRTRSGSLTIWMNEWYDDSVTPGIGDKFRVSEPQQAAGPSEHDTTEIYVVTDIIDIDSFRSRAMRLDGYRTTN
jgi:hypothetical protein